MLPLSHDEVVHGKGSMYGRAPGDAGSKLSNLRAYYSFMWTHPGKKLMFMGNELGQPHEWNHDREIEWDLLRDPGHAGLQLLVADLNRLYRQEPALYGTDCDLSGFDWIAANNGQDSVFAFERRTLNCKLLIVLNMTPVARSSYRIGAGYAGKWQEILNSDSAKYGGSGMLTSKTLETNPIGWNARPQSLLIDLPPLGALVFKMEDDSAGG